GRVGDGAHDVVAIQALVEVDGGGEAGDEGVDGLAEAAAPGLVGLLKAHGRTRGTGQAQRLRNGQSVPIITALPGKPRPRRSAGRVTVFPARPRLGPRVGPAGALWVAAPRAHKEAARRNGHWFNKGRPVAPDDEFFLPELCEPEALLSLVLLAELLVLVLVL